ncbi:hypothetical protein [Geobacter sp.]|uniref:hypothetical protein n=1 Tax=Geobacter sp. TaxID=46610 RepID=UPI001AD3FFA8|nr:hypothetical protein [Geobacter sp.]CAG0982706.1 hypothetical protein GEOBC_01921 [Geobacteraceae bacterium]
MGKVLELVGGPPASGKSTYIRVKYGSQSNREFVHLDYDAMVVKEVERSCGRVAEQDVRDHVSMVYGFERSTVIYGDPARVTVDWPFCVSKRAEEYISIGRNADRFVECNFFTAQATEAWKRSLTRHVAGEYNAFTVFLSKDSNIAEALRPSFRIFLEAHRDMPASVERIFPQVDAAYLWDNNERDAMPVLIALCKKGGKIRVVDQTRWDRFQYKREIDIDAEFEVLDSRVEEFQGKPRTLFKVRYANVIRSGREKEFFV